ncbi:hypothetical protein C7B64_22935 [Merismopedia glauca CCAP 1448/3]|uniref:Uncharacterized protein n=2 Tax=Merismopedia TaxID=53402 RepID=A0A2T1BX19_9CYAN|nr:hypothetical protein C7B64_22935 [Merismopedia glauca CCAP 1448/3]
MAYLLQKRQKAPNTHLSGAKHINQVKSQKLESKDFLQDYWWFVAYFLFSQTTTNQISGK